MEENLTHTVAPSQTGASLEGFVSSPAWKGGPAAVLGYQGEIGEMKMEYVEERERVCVCARVLTTRAGV